MLAGLGAISAALAGVEVSQVATEPLNETAVRIKLAPVEVTAEGEGFVEKLERTGDAWIGERVTVRLVDDGDGSVVKVQAPSAALRTVRMKWTADVPAGARLYTEKTRGEWAALDEWADSLWFFLLDRGDRTEGWGVRTQPNAFVSWRVSPGAVEAVFDVRAGGRGVKLGSRVLDAAVLLRREGIPGESAFAAGRAFCRMMCPTPRLPKEPVYGYNDWYCAYGANTATNFLADAAYVTEMAKGLRTRPYVVMDDGWQPNSPPEIKRKTGVFDSGCGPWEKAGDAFGMDMKTFAGKIAALGAKPGIWYRPMRTWEEVPDEQRLVNDKRFFDPTVPAVKERIAADVVRFRDWGFKLVKADYITYDFCGQYMHNVKDVSHIVPDSVRWRDESRTTAEVMRDVYRTIREAAGDAVVIIGCNAVNHFAAGLFEIQRTGRDTSGWSWQKTAECGVNALGMRNMMNGTFYAADPDCVGLAQEGAVPWEKNREWLELVARSKSPLFISWRRSLATPDVRAAFRAAFAAMCRPGRVGEPLDWQTETLPRRWRFDDGERTYDWFSSGSLGAFENGRRELFGGKDLSNWYTHVRRRGREYDPLNVFAVRGGSIRCSGKEQGWLGSCETFGDVRLEVEFREGGDSGEWNLATLVRKNGVVQRTFARPPTGEIVRMSPDDGRIFLLSEGHAVEFRRVTIFDDSSAASYDVAAYVWPAYQPEPRWAELDVFGAGKGEWQNVWEATPKWEGHVQPLKPLWGYEDESDPKVVEKKIDAAVSHGVNVFIYDWYWYGGRPFLENALDRGFLGASNNGKMKFYLMWANHHVNWLWDNRVEDKKWESSRWRAWVSAEEFRGVTKRWIEKYFRRPNYYRIKGLPVLMIYELSTFVEGVGGLDAAKAALETFRADCVQAGLGGVHLMVCDFGVRENEVKALGVDSATIYNFVHWSSPEGNPDYADWAEKGARRFDVAKEKLGLPCYFAHASVGWDTNPRYPTGSIQPTVLHSTPEKFERALHRAKAWCDRHTPDGFPRLITVNSWNEWTEGSYLEPCEQFGYGYLDAVRKVFGKEGCRVGECEESSSRSRAHRFAVRRAIADSVGTETAESYLTDADPQVRRHALYVIWERDPDRGRARAKTLCGDADAQVARLAADILDPNRNVSKVRSNVPLSQDKTVDHEILRVKTIVPQAGTFRLPAKIDSDAVELWFAQTPKKKVVVSLNGVPAYEFDPVRAEGRAFRADVTTVVRWSAENVVRITDETGAEMSIPFEVEVLKCGG